MAAKTSLDTLETDKLEQLHAFMSAVKAGEKSGDVTCRTRTFKTSHNLDLVSSQIQHGWLVHFTEDPKAILASKLRGVDDHRMLGNTRGWAHGGRSENGFNYAFPIPSKEASYEQSRRTTSGMDPYGDAAFVFQARYVLVHQKGDKQDQAIFLSNEFDAARCIRLTSELNHTQFEARRKLYASENQLLSSTVNGIVQPVPEIKVLSLAETQELQRQARQPSILWTIENGPKAGLKAGWADVIKAVLPPAPVRKVLNRPAP